MPIKTEYKYMVMKRANDYDKEGVWNITNKLSGVVFAVITWYAPWRGYCFFTRDHMIFNKKSLKEVLDFIDQLEKERIE